MYRAIGLLKPDTDFTIAEAERRLAQAFPGFTINRAADRVDVTRGDWWIALARAADERVAQEIEGLAGHIAGVEPDEAAAYVAAGARVEVWTDVPDPLMEHFNDYLKVIEVLKSFKGLLAVDPKERGVL
ncbi:hypothetical protein R5W23_004327 [Gemmata sp. JC673]|uniref:Uncharacterized protein n=1 Tax=Gemmata algarum TaxID=2975278 RepID=A0ABU5F7X4_9BACT|nr:hypothetical protein [Gemmata algarum]MDY3562847.1 hypothetical protein [Gemmata algarum]